MKQAKRFLGILLVLCLIGAMVPGTALAARSAVEQTLRLPEAAPAVRQTVSLNGAWTFTSYDGSRTTVQVPHSWEYTNPEAYSPAGSVRTSTYERTVSVGEFAGKRLFLQFDAVNKAAVVSVDGVEVGRHDGGFTAFALDITEACRGKDTVTIQVAVTNITTDTMPVNTDFTHFAGIYRDVRLVAVDPRAYLALEDDGSQGVYLRAAVDLASGKATLTPTVLLSSYEAGKVTVQVTLKDAKGCIVGTVCKTLELTGKQLAQEVTLESITVPNVHLWQGTEDPYLYTVETTVCVGRQKVDSNIQKTGFRTYEVKDGMFYLNGKVYALRGVGMHQEYGAATNVTTKVQKAQDIQTVLEMGANALRTSHYPHDQYLYDLCDANGIVVWNEIPFYLLMLDTEEFRENVLRTAAEMVKQGLNHPSILIWGIQNEVNYYESYDAYYDQPDAAALGAFMQELAQTVKTLDPSRLVAQAVIDNTAFVQQTAGWTTAGSGIDVVGFNLYPGWYNNVNGATQANQMERVVNSFQSKLKDYQNRFVGSGASYVLSEYGAGGNIAQHADMGADFIWGGTDESKGYTTTGSFHPEEYQSYVHEAMLMALYGDETNGVAPAEDLWCAFTWAMFDFSSFRNEGGQTRLNTKGLVTADRSVKKDAFYLYKANWNDTDPFVHITSSRYEIRPSRTVDVKVYSNCDTVELTVNGQFYGAGELQQDGVFVWKGVELNELGQFNHVLATGVRDGKTYTDVCDTWVAGDAAEITVTNTLDKTYDGLPTAEPQYRVTLRGGEIDITEDAEVTVQWYERVSGAPVYGSYPNYGSYPTYGDSPGYAAYPSYPAYGGYPAYGAGQETLRPLEGPPTEAGSYLCVLTAAGGSNGVYTWTSGTAAVAFEIEAA